MELDESSRLVESQWSFSKAATQFYETGTNNAVSRAYFEYSTLMDAFSIVQKARAKKKMDKDYEGSLDLFSRSSEILRATLHFGFLSSYISACAILEEAHDFESPDDDLFQAYKNAIALLEHSKIALGLRDEKNLVMQNLEAMLKFSIGGALRTEGDILSLAGTLKDAQMKYAQSNMLRNEYLELARSARIKVDTIPFFPLDDYQRVQSGSYVVTYPDADNLWALNLGKNPAIIQTIGSNEIETRILSGEAFAFPMRDLPKGKIRIRYIDNVTRNVFDEGCIIMI